jgi:hypothetical protein
MSRKPPIFKRTDLRKAFEGARDAGITARVDILRDGTIRLTPVALQAPAAAPDVNEWDRVLSGKPPVRP